MTLFRIFPLILLLALASTALAAEPYLFRDATVKGCTDGDTCKFDFHEKHPIFGRVTWKGHAVRLAGIDAPELHPARCPKEKAAGQAARERLLALLQGAKTLEVTIIAREKYGRLLGKVSADGKDAAAALLAAGLVRPYESGRRKSWCG